MAVALEQFVKQLTDSGIIAPGKLEKFIPPNATPKDAQELARQLVQSKQLTKFQAQEIYAGRAKSLILGNYTILEKIGAGGMGQVFKAEHRRMDRTVAIKMLPTAMMKDSATVARFEREVRAAAKLEHPNIVHANDADESNGVHFLVMQYVEGNDLSVLVKKNGPFSVGQAINYILQAARGLEFAHKKGVVHRDIKPANLLLDQDGVVKILDMGLARIETGGDVAAQAELTGTGAVMGTVDYMAPEQGLSTKHADARTDIYSLGCSLHYLLIGKPTFDGETITAKLLAHHHQPIPNLCQLREDVPEQVQTIFSKMVAKAVKDRRQTMTEVIADLERCQVAQASPSASTTVNTSSSSATQEAEMTVAIGGSRQQSIGAVETSYVKPAKKSGPKFSRPALIGLVAAGLLGVAALAGVIFKTQTKDGTLVVEVNQPDAVVQVLNEEGKVEISDRSGKTPITVSVDPGKHKIKVEKDGFVAFGQDFELESGGKVSITAKLEPVQAVAVVGEPNTTATPPLAKAPFHAAQAKAHQAAWAKHLGTTVESKNSVGMSLVLIPPGEFLMGSTPEQIAIARKMGEDDKMPPTGSYFGRLAEEMPQHKVTISQPFLIGSTEVTVAQFRKFVEASKYVTEAEQYGFGNASWKVLNDKVGEASKGKNWKNPGYPITDDTAVTQATWNDAVAYCTWLSEQEQRRAWYRPDGKGGWLIAAHADGYRLPTEAEWEYACRAGTTTQFSFGDDKTQLERYGWFDTHGGGNAQPVALKPPNPFGLFDMHGNAHEWCQDWHDGKWYEKSSPNDPLGPSSGSMRVLRGGDWNYTASLCRCAFRSGDWPSYRNLCSGFRIARPLDASQPETAVATTAKPTASPTKPTKPWETPEFQQWVADTQALAAEKQVEAVSRKLMELNPGFDGKVTGVEAKGTPKVENGMVKELGFVTDSVTDISPVRAFPGLRLLNCSGSSGKSGGMGTLSDLSALSGMKLTRLLCSNTQVSDLSPLREMPLTSLTCERMPVSDLSPLRGLKLTILGCGGTRVTDLSPLAGMPLAVLNCNGTQISDLSPLRGMPLAIFSCDSAVQVSDLSPLRGIPLRSLSCQSTKVADLSSVEECQSLTSLNLKQTHVTAAGVAALGMALPNCKIEWDDPTKAPTAPATDTAPPLAKAPFHAAQAKAHQAAWAKHLGTTVESKNSVGMSLVLIPPGEFLMGSTPEQNAIGRRMAEDAEMPPADEYWQRLPEEIPQHKVTITQPFLMGSTEVTVAHFRKFVEAIEYVTEQEKADKRKNWKNPGYVTTEDTAVTQITWNDACANCAWLSEQELRRPWYRPDGRGGWLIAAFADGYRLPTEAEWEYGCRAGTTTQYSFGDDESQLEQYGWFIKNHRSGAQPVALKLPNPFGLFDVHGNALEWCQDAWDPKWYEKSSPADPNGPSSGSRRIMRGGSWPYGASVCRSAFRSYDSPSSRFVNTGFRIVRPLDPTQPETAVASTTEPNATATKPTKPWNTPTFQAWIKTVAALPAEKQIETVSKKLMELNPEFDGRLTNIDESGPPKIEKGVVMELRFHSLHVTDISPLRAFSKLNTLLCYPGGNAGSQLADLSPLQGVPLAELRFSGTSVSDLSPLEGMPLRAVQCDHTHVSDLSPLEDCKSLRTLNLRQTQVTPATVAALQKALPNCKLEWDDPSKATTAQPSKPWNTPAIQAWMKEVQALPAEQQIEAVAKKLVELNPGFDGKVTPTFGNGVVTNLGFVTDNVVDISAVRALVGLRALSCTGSGPGKGMLSDLSPLKGMKLTSLDLGKCGHVSDLSPLKDMPLTWLNLWNCNEVSDVSPLQGIPLTYLDLNNCGPVRDLSSLRGMKLNHLDLCGCAQVRDLTPLQGMPLTWLSLYACGQVRELTPLQGLKLTWLCLCKCDQVRDLTPLRGMPLEMIRFSPKYITKGLDVIRQMKSLKTIATGSGDKEGFLPDEFWRKYDAGEFGKPIATFSDAAFQQWMKEVQAMPAEEQIKAVSKKLMEMNAGFDGKVLGPGGNSFPKIKNGVVTELKCATEKVTDISPVRALTGLEKLDCSGSREQKGTLSDLSPLQGLSLNELQLHQTEVSSLSALQGMPLTALTIDNTKVSDFLPLKGMPLTTLNCSGVPVSDFSPLGGMPLTRLSCHGTLIFDLSPLQECKGLLSLKVHNTKVTPASIAALQKALPNCKIEWDDPAKPKAPEPAASGTK